jgi:DNA polymerase
MSEDPPQALRDARAYLRWLKRAGIAPPRMRGDATPEEMLMPRRTQTAGPTQQSATAPVATPRTQGGQLVTTFAGDTERVRLLNGLSETVTACRKCPLGSTRRNAVFGIGNPDADLVFIGEAPGATEDETGKPFVGPAGNLLTQELARNGITRDEVFICNILKCRPPGNRDPQPDEIMACEPHLLRQLDTLKPKMLCSLGRFAATTLLRSEIKIMKCRGTWESYHDIPLFICLHPAAVLHQPGNRDLFVGDVARLAKAYHARNA